MTEEKAFTLTPHTQKFIEKQSDVIKCQCNPLKMCLYLKSNTMRILKRNTERLDNLMTDPVKCHDLVTLHLNAATVAKQVIAINKLRNVENVSGF